MRIKKPGTVKKITAAYRLPFTLARDVKLVSIRQGLPPHLWVERVLTRAVAQADRETESTVS